MSRKRRGVCSLILVLYLFSTFQPNAANGTDLIRGKNVGKRATFLRLRSRSAAVPMRFVRRTGDAVDEGCKARVSPAERGSVSRSPTRGRQKLGTIVGNANLSGGDASPLGLLSDVSVVSRRTGHSSTPASGQDDSVAVFEPELPAAKSKRHPFGSGVYVKMRRRPNCSEPRPALVPKRSLLASLYRLGRTFYSSKPPALAPVPKGGHRLLADSDEAVTRTAPGLGITGWLTIGVMDGLDNQDMLAVSSFSAIYDPGVVLGRWRCLPCANTHLPAAASLVCSACESLFFAKATMLRSNVVELAKASTPYQYQSVAAIDRRETHAMMPCLRARNRSKHNSGFRQGIRLAISDHLHMSIIPQRPASNSHQCLVYDIGKEVSD
ncbi:hypothetical protein EV356DRAFT_564085 [Viridothelium virens]|uniref:Uncharacterized protein n=1 Tax=Viridothelium virens TaxID=1048519 RepID=A0A6A6HLG8_VIRVR|nr:hypothetical protein EV356DRAFT_564085 [Viridothelium virens]